MTAWLRFLARVGHELMETLAGTAIADGAIVKNFLSKKNIKVDSINTL